MLKGNRVSRCKVVSCNNKLPETIGIWNLAQPLEGLCRYHVILKLGIEDDGKGNTTDKIDEYVISRGGYRYTDEKGGMHFKDESSHYTICFMCDISLRDKNKVCLACIAPTKYYYCQILQKCVERVDRCNCENPQGPHDYTCESGVNYEPIENCNCKSPQGPHEFYCESFRMLEDNNSSDYGTYQENDCDCGMYHKIDCDNNASDIYECLKYDRDDNYYRL